MAEIGDENNKETRVLTRSCTSGADTGQNFMSLMIEEVQLRLRLLLLHPPGNAASSGNLFIGLLVSLKESWGVFASRRNL